METNFEELQQANRRVASERLMGDLKTLAKDAEDLLKATAGDVSNKGKEIRERLAGTLERAKATCADIQNQTVLKAKAAAVRTDTVIRDHPYESIAVGLGIGLLFGILIAKNR